MAANGNSNIKNFFPSDHRVSMTSEREMVCGKCGPASHYIYEISSPNLGDMINDPECAQCSVCEDIRPTNTAGNELLHQLKVIPTSEYLSWADTAQ